MLTNAQADATYQQAFAALHSIVIDPSATSEEVALARDKRDLLTLDFIGQAIVSIEERTKKFQAFIDEMNAVIAEFGSSSLLDGVRKLKSVVDTAGVLIGAALPTPAVAKKRSAKRAAKVGRRGGAAKERSAKKPAGAAKKPAKALKKSAKSAKKPAKSAKKPAKAVKKSAKSAKKPGRARTT
jgi:adenylate kinase